MIGGRKEAGVLITGAGSSWTTGGDIFTLVALSTAPIMDLDHSSSPTAPPSMSTAARARSSYWHWQRPWELLIVDSTLNGLVTVNTDGRLGGSGTIGNTTVLGTIAPGNSIGTLNVAGNLTMPAGSTYEVEANAAGQADKIAATGTVTINGGTVKVLAGAGTYAPSTTYTIINAAGGVGGIFTDVTSNFAFLAPTADLRSDQRLFDVGQECYFRQRRYHAEPACNWWRSRQSEQRRGL